MNMTSLKIKVAAVLLTAAFATSALAVTPPAPPEWYQRIKMPIPETIKSGQMPHNPDIEKDLAMAAARQPDNTDHILQILVEFPDNLANQIDHPPSAYEDMMFSTGVISTGSLVEYYQEVSYGTFTPAGTVTVWIMAPHPYTYYSQDNGMGSYPNNSQGLLEDCVGLLDDELDFSQFDNNGDGYAEGIFMVHAGPGAEETGNYYDIWSHAWYYDVQTGDGVSTGRYSIEPEEFMDGSMISIGVYCHEYGHVLGLPDLYDYDGTSEGIGVYCLMAGGSWGALPGNPERPTHMCAEMKRRLGWMTPTTITGTLMDLYLPPAELTPVSYRINHPTDPQQYFLIENRAKIGFDSLMRGDGGLAIWHVDRNGWQDDETHPYVALEQADGNFDLMRDYGTGNRHPRTNRGDAGDLYPGAAENTYFSFSSTPNSYDYNLSQAFMTIDDIRQHGDSILADVCAAPDLPIYHVKGVSLDDDIAGYTSNLNHKADSGEAVDITVSLYCDGEGAAVVSGKIETDDPRVEILDSLAVYAASTHNAATSNGADPFRVQVLSASVDSAVTFHLAVEADGQIYETDFKMNINRPKIAVVLDNNRSHWSDNLLEAMTRTGYSFDTLWNNSVGWPNAIEYDDLIGYHAVVWTTGSYFGNRTSSPDFEDCLSDAEVAVLEDYLDNNGRLGLFSQDYFYDRGVDAFALGYLHIGGVTQDVGSASSLVGVQGPYVNGFDYYVKPWSYYDYTDGITSSPGAVAFLDDDSLAGTVMVGSPLTPQVGSYATSMATLGVERLDDASLARLLTAWCQWILTNTNIDVPLPTAPVDGDTAGTAPVFYWTESPGAASYHIQIAGDFAFNNIVRETSVAFNGTSFAQPFEPGIYYWRVNASPDSKTATAYSPRAQFVIEEQVVYICGDNNGDGAVNVADAVYVINYVFKFGPPADPLCEGDANGDGAVNVGDAVYVINYVFMGGPPPLGNCCP